MVMKNDSGVISLSGRVPGRASEPSRTRVDDDGGVGAFRGIEIGRASCRERVSSPV